MRDAEVERALRDQRDEIVRLRSLVAELNQKLGWLDRGLKDAQLYINALNKRAGIKGGFVF